MDEIRTDVVKHAEGGSKILTMVDKSALSPLYLHPSEGPGNLITMVQLKGWGGTMKIGLSMCGKPCEPEKIRVY